MQFLAFVTAALLPIVALSAPAHGVTSSIVTRTATATTSTLGSVTLPTSDTVLTTSTIVTTTLDSSPAPSPTPVDNGACDKLVQQCAVDDEESPYGDLGTVFNKWSCVMAFACRAPAENVDDVIYEMWHSKAQYPNSLEEPRLSTNIFADHSSDGKVWTQQNFIDAYYGKLSSIGGPYPSSVNLVIGYWSNIAAWTGFCASKAIPYQNLADWYTYSSTVQGAAASC